MSKGTFGTGFTKKTCFSLFEEDWNRIGHFGVILWETQHEQIDNLPGGWTSPSKISFEVISIDIVPGPSISGAKWLLKGFNSPSLRVPFGRCWNMSFCFLHFLPPLKIRWDVSRHMRRSRWLRDDFPQLRLGWVKWCDGKLPWHISKCFLRIGGFFFMKLKSDWWQSSKLPCFFKIRGMWLLSWYSMRVWSELGRVYGNSVVDCFVSLQFAEVFSRL